MKIGIDSYCYHRFFGEVYPQQTAPPKRITLEEFIARARQLGVDGVSLESCYIRCDRDYLAGVKETLDRANLDRVWAWGHPDGLEGGTNQPAWEQMIANFEHARAIGAKVMRVVGSSLRFRRLPHEPQIERLSRMFTDAVKVAEEYGIRMAVENHIDFTAEEMLRLLRNVNSPYFGMNFDSGNFVRLLDDPVKAMERLAPYVLATHIKDLTVRKSVPVDEWFFFSSVPVGDGIVDNQRLAQLLAEAGYQGFLAVEIDFLDPGYGDDEDAAVEKSVQELRRIAQAVSSRTGAPARK
jgi:sugar phosphate isomerase/epimerase